MRRLSSLLAVVMVLSFVPCPALAQADTAEALPRPVAAEALLAPRSPSGALAIGLLATLGPACVATLAAGAGGQGSAAGPALAGAMLGVVGGPAIGLACGGRPDLAQRGLGIRLGGTVAMAVGLLGVAQMMQNERTDPLSMSLFSLGVVGALATAGSAAVDLAITPSAVAAGQQRLHTSLAVRPDGAVAVQLKF